jgi:oxalate decarboxylase
MLTATAAGAMVSATTTARAGSFGNPDEPPQGAINAKNPAGVTDPGPQNHDLWRHPTQNGASAKIALFLPW